MMRLYNNPEVWDPFFTGYSIRSLGELGFEGAERAVVNEQEPPKILQSMRSRIEEFWGDLLNKIQKLLASHCMVLQDLLIWRNLKVW